MSKYGERPRVDNPDRLFYGVVFAVIVTAILVLLVSLALNVT